MISSTNDEHRVHYVLSRLIVPNTVCERFLSLSLSSYVVNAVRLLINFLFLFDDILSMHRNYF